MAAAPDNGRPVTDGSAVNLPIVTYLGSEFVPAYTSASRLLAAAAGPGGRPGAGRAARRRARRGTRQEAARRARHRAEPGCGRERPGVPGGCRVHGGGTVRRGGRRIRVGHPPAEPGALLSEIRSLLPSVPAARAAATAWLSVDLAGEGLVISVTLDDPADRPPRMPWSARSSAPPPPRRRTPAFPIDVTFPGEGAANPVDEWISANASPFYGRS